VRLRHHLLVVLACGLCIGLVACGGSEESDSGREPLPAPDVELTAEEEQVWAELPPDRSVIPVLLYHGVGPETNFSDPTDASFGIGHEDFAKQMTLIRNAGYETIDLETLIGFVQGEPVDLPPRPLLLTFDDARADSWTGADEILDELGFNAVMFVDVGRVEDGDPEYLTWEELATVEDSDRWQLQLHSGRGHVRIPYGPGPDDQGPFYAYEKPDENFGQWRDRVRKDITWGEETLADHISAFEPLSFALPYGSYGQDGTNDKRIPVDLLGWLTGRYGVVFTQDGNRVQPGAAQPLGRIQVTRSTTGGEVYELLLSGGP
jgi:peptidoglycan/xylan/chitin deacetylase (PgdA/CDA1 family)